MVLLETAQQNDVAKFAIEKLKKHFPQLLRQTNVAWLSRLAQRPIAAVHELLVDILQNTPELHPAKLEGLGPQARGALAAALAVGGGAQVRRRVRPRPRDRPPARHRRRLRAHRRGRDARLGDVGARDRATGRPWGCRCSRKLLGNQPTSAWAITRLESQFDRAELTDAFFVELVYGTNSQRDWARKYLAERVKQSEQLAAFIKALFADPRRQDAAQTQQPGALHAASCCR